MLRPEIFKRARDWPTLYLANTPTGMGVPQKNFNRENLKFGLKFSVLASNNFGAGASIFTKFLQTTCREAGVITRVQLLEGQGQKFGRVKKRPNLGAIFDNFRLWSRISPERMDKANIWKNLINHYSFHVGRKKFGELWSTKKVLVAHIDQPMWTFFLKLHFSH